ncbi:7929_t:CDS:2, partial [Ambispora gerdemannii]
ILDSYNMFATYKFNEREQVINTLYQVYEKYKPAKEITIQLDSNEINTYLSEPETEAEPLLWWRANAMQYLTLARIAMDYLAIQATSVPSEQAFSIAKHIVSLNRNRIDPETARASLCLKSWYTELDDI